MDGTHKKSARRPSREEIVDLFRACAAKNEGKTPGKIFFDKTCGISEAQVNRHFWKGGYTELAQAPELQSNLLQRERFAVIIDAEVRSAGYVLGTEDRKFLEYAQSHGAELRRQGFENLYFVIVGSSFKGGDLRKLVEALSASLVRSANLLTASALMRLVEDSIRDRSKFSLGEFERQLFAHDIIAT